MARDMQINEYIGEFLIAGSGVVASITAYVKGKKDAKSIELDNIEKAIVIYKDAANYLRDDLDLMKAEISKLKKNHEICEESKKQLEAKVDELDRKFCEIRK